jgi:hypothetical protein
LAGVFVATEIILFLKGESQLKNKLLQYVANYHHILEIDYQQSKKCHLHESVSYQFFKTSLNVTNTFKELLIELKNKFNSDYYINWYEEFIYSMECESCGKEMLIKKFKSHIYDKDRWCTDCQDKYNESEGVKAKWLINKELFLTNPNHKFFLELPMSDFSIKENDIIIVDNLQSSYDKVLVLI